MLPLRRARSESIRGNEEPQASSESPLLGDEEERCINASLWKSRTIQQASIPPLYAREALTPLNRSITRISAQDSEPDVSKLKTLPQMPVIEKATTQPQNISFGSHARLKLFDFLEAPGEVVTSKLYLSGEQNHNGERRHPGDLKRVTLEPVTEQSISLLNTIAMYAVKPSEDIELQQQEFFINDVVEDISRRATIEVPQVTLGLEQQARLDKHNMVAKTASGAAIAGIGDFTAAMLRYITNVVMTHMVSLSTYGIFVETYTAITVAGYASKFGLDSATLRFLSTYRVKGQRNLVAGILRFAFYMSLISGIVCGALFFLLSSFLAHIVYHKEVYELPFKEAALLIPLIGIQLVVASGLQALKAIKWKVYTDRLIQPALTLVLLGVFYLLGLRLEALILATICGFLASNITGQFLLRKASRRLVHGIEPKYERKTWMLFALPMFLNSMIRNVLNSTDVLFLGALATTSQVGLYGAADRVSYFVVMPLIALNVIFSPIIAEYHARGEHRQLENMFKIVTKWSFTLSLPVFLCCLVFHDAILAIFGEKYLAAGLVLIILSFGNLVDSGAGSVNYLLVMTGRPRVILANTVTTIMVNVSLVFLLVPHLNIIGAALAAALSIITLNVMGLIEVNWLLRIHPYRRDFLKPIVAGSIASMVGLLLLRVVHLGYGHLAIFGTLGLIFSFMLIYGLVLASLHFSEEDMMVLEAVRTKLGKKKSA